MASPLPVPAQYRIDGAYGEAYRDGKWLADVVEVSGTITIDRVEVPMAGSVSTGYKRGRVQREGNLRFQKVDDRWEREFMAFSSLSLAQRRAARNAGNSVGAPFALQVTIDDPEAIGASSYMFYNVTLWGMPMGYSISDMQEKQVPITWDSEELLEGIDIIGAVDPID